ncbi:MAG: YciI family protein [Acidimicrobiales bacterium]
MAFFAVTTMRGAAWEKDRGIREQPQWAEHADFADRLVEDGRIILGGPIEDADDEVVALIAVEAPGVAAVHEVFADDPWVRSGILALKDVRPWTIWLRADKA